MAEQRGREPFWFDIWFCLVLSNVFFVVVYYLWGLFDISQIPAR